MDGEPVAVLPGQVVPPSTGESELVAELWSTVARIAREHARQAASIAEPARRRRVPRTAARRRGTPA